MNDVITFMAIIGGIVFCVGGLAAAATFFETGIGELVLMLLILACILAFIYKVVVIVI